MAVIQNVTLGISIGALTSHLSLDATYINGLVGVTLGNLIHVTVTIFSCVVVSLIVACEDTDNIRTVAALTCENNLWKRYHDLLDEPMRQGFKNAFLVSIPFAFANYIVFLVTVLVFWYGSKLFMNNEYDLKKMYTVYVAIIIGSNLKGLFFAYAPDIANAAFASNSIMSLLERVPKIDTWRQDVLQSLNLEVKSGQYAALVGPSGCGKSTIMSLIERFYQMMNGTITIDEMIVA
ncbi:P-loop containing nucleoside triphosphate hydrolase protein [Gigaspora margarita]|uniref:P-loop containing nucleoside triphosphate hydrolase protein n=1 Tax=Gigaspora margarita TaxID=4874 RepID=A0A8H4AC15_GIGMA|nr:P-loop containing nucleoside triphosphate hydrolase protein [Gigaspora margarita]